MGQALVDYYARAYALGGVAAKVKLAGITGITSTQAPSAPDSAENLAAFDAAFKLLGGDARTTASGNTSRPRFAPPGDGEASLRRFNRVIAEMMGQRNLLFARPDDTYARITEAAAEGLDVSRASIWLYDADKSRIHCADLFERAEARHSSGIALKAVDFPGYFRALSTERTIAADDAHQDARTSEFSRSYLTPLGIQSMLDVPIWVGGEMKGVVCNEQIGKKRAWTADDENFAFAMSGFVALAEELRQSRKR